MSVAKQLVPYPIAAKTDPTIATGRNPNLSHAGPTNRAT